MSYQSFGFILFSVAALILYYAVGKKRQCWVLAAANLAFYLIAGSKYLPFLLITMFASFFAGKGISSVYRKADEQLKTAADAAQKKEIRAASKKKAKRILLTGMFIALILLIVCKYTTFILNNVNFFLSLADIPQITMFRLVLPLGISFYTFMAISYVLDIYWKRYPAEKNFLTFAVYLSYFPHIVQGPIDRFNEFKPQLEQGVDLSYKNITHGAQLALWGFFKKLVIADRLGIFVDSVFNNWAQQDGIFIILAVTVFSIQIYADFSGCIDIVTGVSEMFGIKLRKNFNHPYFSKTMPEFWRRWHMSLMEWFKDYVYYPVSAAPFTKKVKKNLKNKNHARAGELFASCFPILAVWLVTGLWHGAAWKFAAWGMFHAALLIGSKVFENTFQNINHRLHINTEKFGFQLWQMLRTFILCCIGRIFFRAQGFMVSLSLIKQMITNTSLSALAGCDLASFGLDWSHIAVAVFSMIVLLVVDILQEKMPLRETLGQKNIFLRWVLIFGCLFAVLLFGIYGPGYDASNFIYEQF